MISWFEYYRQLASSYSFHFYGLDAPAYDMVCVRLRDCSKATADSRARVFSSAAWRRRRRSRRSSLYMWLWPKTWTFELALQIYLFYIILFNLFNFLNVTSDSTCVSKVLNSTRPIIVFTKPGRVALTKFAKKCSCLTMYPIHTPSTYVCDSHTLFGAQ
jgi:hypothetical protein